MPDRSVCTSTCVYVHGTDTLHPVSSRGRLNVAVLEVKPTRLSSEPEQKATLGVSRPADLNSGTTGFWTAPCFKRSVLCLDRQCRTGRLGGQEKPKFRHYGRSRPENPRSRTTHFLYVPRFFELWNSFLVWTRKKTYVWVF